MRQHLILAGLAFTLGAFGWAVVKKEAVLSEGQMVLLELAPVDPRSLMQGDYMILDYKLLDVLAKHELNRTGGTPEHEFRDGLVILKLDERRVGRFSRLEDGSPLSADELRLTFKKRGASIQLGAESFFFQEGSADTFNVARFGELRVDDDGTSILVGLRDESLRVLGAEQRLH
tara:strand:+ start:107 stop:628 length:522 start_codon:yes stop_codon:yes gene_type:complete